MIIHRKAYAKINLYLKILNKLPNGYHNIFTVMQRISLCDDIKINIKSPGKNNIYITCSDESISGKSNTAYKAAVLFLQNSGMKCDVGIEIKKNIPSRAGLGGGSSDAAAVLSALNEYFDNALSEKELIKLAAETGADVPFFVRNKSRAVCRGIGEIITPVRAELNGFYAVIVKPAYDISTKQAFRDFDNFKNFNNFCDLSKFKNDFTALAFSQNKNLELIQNLILESGASESGITGSGPALFGIFGDAKKAGGCADSLKLRDDVEFCGIFDFV